MKKLISCLLVFAPPYIFSQTNPGIFFKALGLVGGYAAIVLFGFIPTAISYKQSKKLTINHRKKFYKKLFFILTFSSLILSLEILKSLNILN